VGRRTVARESRTAFNAEIGAAPGVSVGVIAVVSARGEVYVEFDGCPGARPVEARTLVALDGDAVGREAVLGFVAGDPRRPIVLGLLRAKGARKRVDVTLDRRRVTVQAEKELVLKCGDASITLTRTGQVLIEGRYVLTRSSGVNRLLGASIQLN
jgi:hypothetical protein